MKLLILALCLAFFSVPLNAQGYDYNYYNTYPNKYGGATVYGANPATGSVWTTDIEKNGDMSGFDANMHPWTYNADTGYYYNYGSGTMCYGHGALRSCY